MKIMNIQGKKMETNNRAVRAVIMLGISVLALMPGAAMAAPWDSTASSVLEIFTGGLTRTIAIISVIAMGIAAMAGKLSWDWAIKITVGIVLIFGSTAIVDYIIGAAS
jgi:type IV secretory pathway VirB2 component (pilin)